MPKPCRKCGAADRYQNGKCRPCTKARSKALAASGVACQVCGATDRFPSGNCRPCEKAWRGKNRPRARAYARKSMYKKAGWAPGEYERAEALRPFVAECALCRTTNPGGNHGWQADHDHATGKFRAFLCSRCNLKLGAFESTTADLAVNAAAYILKHGGALGVLQPLAALLTR